MREIKFRGFDRKFGQWRYGYYYSFESSGRVIATIMTEHGSNFMVDPDSVGQYTGLHDRNGKEIYDRDLCVDDDGKSLIEIVWSGNHQWGCRIVKGRALSQGLTFPLFHWDEHYHNGFRQLEVIGNIYEHPHLLGEKGEGH